MRVEAAVQKRAIEMLIDINPTSITVSRETYVSERGARVKQETTVGPFDIAIYSNVIRTAPKTYGAIVDAVKLEKVDWTALAKADTDIRSGSNVVDYFTTDRGEKFKVETVVDIETMRVTTGKLLLLEMIR